MTAPMPVLYRAQIDVPDPHHLGPMLAFVAAFSADGARSKLQAMLPPLLCAQGPVRVVFPMSEAELMSVAIGPASDGDARMLEVGRRPSGYPAHADRARTLLLLPPPLLKRMQIAHELAWSLS